MTDIIYTNNSNEKKLLSDSETARLIVEKLYDLCNEATKQQLETTVDSCIAEIIQERYGCAVDLEALIIQYRNVRKALIDMKIIAYNGEDYSLIPEEISDEIYGRIDSFDYSTAIAEPISEDTSYFYAENQREKFELKVLERVREMEPRQFERLMAKLLRAYGFEFYPGIGVRDNGIDGYGYYKINSLLKFKVIIQCKRYQEGNNISNASVRDLRGAVSTDAFKGIFVTTSAFTSMAKAEAEKFPQIDLIDGRQLVKMLIEKKIGIEYVEDMGYRLDKSFFTTIEL